MIYKCPHNNRDSWEYFREHIYNLLRHIQFHIWRINHSHRWWPQNNLKLNSNTLIYFLLIYILRYIYCIWWLHLKSSRLHKNWCKKNLKHNYFYLFLHIENGNKPMLKLFSWKLNILLHILSTLILLVEMPTKHSRHFFLLEK